MNIKKLDIGQSCSHEQTYTRSDDIGEFLSCRNCGMYLDQDGIWK